MKLVIENHLSRPRPVMKDHPMAFDMSPEELARIYAKSGIMRDAHRDFRILSEGATVLAKSDDAYYEIMDGVIIQYCITYADDQSDYTLPIHRVK